ncbi:MAG: BrnT family toxin [Treponema sp.]|jgi:uncharacterized DUF497 family protein|nr:BrnT family toxin [Treponema sp.]
MTDRKIVWDLEKAAENWIKHRVTFDSAALVFLDPLRIERLDDSEGNTSGEERRQTLGQIGGVYFVVYTERGDETRLISARRANKAEKRSYYGRDDINAKGWSKAD